MLDGSHLVAFVGSRDLASSNEFYAGALGLERVESTPFANVYDVGGTMLRVTEVKTVTSAPYTVLGWNVADIKASVESLLASGVAFKRYDGMDQDDAGIWTAPGGAKVVWFEDPDGNTLSLSQLSAP
ncbi:MAG: VOC family protein [Solirubrobacteraceae bacterium]